MFSRCSSEEVEISELSPRAAEDQKLARNPFAALVVITMSRNDLLELHLSSIDKSTSHVFVVLNYADEVSRKNTISSVSKFDGCKLQHTSFPGNCSNPHILQLHLIAFPQNVGVSGAMNVGLKAMMTYDLPYAMFSGDDTRFRPARLAKAQSIIANNTDVCVFLFEGYASHAISRSGASIIGPWDENFWPAFAEDCDIWFRAQLEGCKMFYRAKYRPEGVNEDSGASAFVDHGDFYDPAVSASTTHKSQPELSKLVERTLDGSRGRFKYLVRKWGVDVCPFYHEVLHTWRNQDEILDPATEKQLEERRMVVKVPYNDPVGFKGTDKWLRNDWKLTGAVSSRAVNVKDAPDTLVWQQEDYRTLEKYSRLGLSQMIVS